ncbi:MAG: D-TA family PLP-dependent enzyme [Chitinophagaceae bacterium]
MSDNTKWYEIKNIAELDSPVLVIFTDRVKRNIQTAIKMVGDIDRLRPHIKTHKSPDVTRLMIDAGITKFKCATIAEAEMLGQCGAKDVVLAYQPLGPKLKRFIEVIKKYSATQFSCLTDNKAAVKEQADAFASAGLVIPVYLDLNVGMNRTGINPGDQAIELYKYASGLKGIKVNGLHAYDGHLRNQDIELRTKECNEGFAFVKQMKEDLEKSGYAVPVVIAGGSPAFPIHAKRKNVECSPGTFVYWDKGYTDLCPEQDFLPAAVLVTRIISLPSPTRITADLGHKSVAAENEITRRIFFLNADNVKPVGQSEEHLVLEVNAGHSYKVGDILYGIPFHVCPTIALYERAYTIENGKVTGEWKTIARDRKLTV